MTEFLTFLGENLIGVLIAGFMTLLVWIIKRQSETYTKRETGELIDLKLRPISDSLDRNSDQLARVTEVLDKFNTNLQLLHIDYVRMAAKEELRQELFAAHKKD